MSGSQSQRARLRPVQDVQSYAPHRGYRSQAHARLFCSYLYPPYFRGQPN